MKKKYYVTTPIYYVNDQPHVGHVYTSVAADALAVFRRMTGREVFFLTGTDEHGQKVEEAARKNTLEPQAHADKMVRNFQSLWKQLGLTNDAFIRTTDPRHKDVVRELLQRLWEEGRIVKRAYEGWYCTPCERFWTQKDVEGHGACPECHRPVESIEEENYFFLMSEYAGALLKHIEDNPGYILPESRRNEVLGFLKANPLGDLCISRPKSRLSWGVELPFDPGYVSYVWFDALINYYSATRFLAPGGEPEPEDFWPADVHIIGKDILTTHAVYWSTMLMALGLPLPKCIFAHGWWTIEGRKMSKSLGNVVNPREMAGKYGNDALRYFLLREVTFGLDGDFSEAALIRRVNTELANDFGNLISRVLKMTERYFGGRVPVPDAVNDEIKGLAEGILGRVEEELSALRFQRALDAIWELVSYSNKYIDTAAPWVLARDMEANGGRLATVMYSSCEALRFLSILLHPFMPEATRRLYAALMGGGADVSKLDAREALKWGGLAPGTALGELDALFPRIEDTTKKKDEKTAGPAKAVNSDDAKKDVKKDETPAGLITIDEFFKAVLKTGRIVGAKRVEGSEKLLALQVDTGEPRQVVAGIGKAYTPEELIGKTVVVVANLKPAKLMGLKSEGMILAVGTPDGGLSVLVPDREAEAGVRVS